MQKIGSYIAFFGLFAIILKFFGRVPKFLFWVYNWGETVGWLIMIAFVIIGGGLYFLGKKRNEEMLPPSDDEEIKE